jgi:hypothetical protein
MRVNNLAIIIDIANRNVISYVGNAPADETIKRCGCDALEAR